MATLQTDDANILDAETINWRLIVYPILAALVVVTGGFGYYYYQQEQRDQLEASARAALVAAKAPEDMVKVADQFPGADQATVALLNAANGFFARRDFTVAAQTYQRIVQTVTTNRDLRDSAQMGLASTFEANGKLDDAITAYLVVAREGAKSPFAPDAYNSAARLYEQRGDKDNERKILTEAASLDADFPSVKEARSKLTELTRPPLIFPQPPPPAPASK